ncbi:ISAzo13 family transposase [Bradyrhizobium sp. RT7a]|uniref:ISAzo13 family transposase n=2 Tax=Bradyrhizobium TaxID=374 RepID=UPI0033952A66
MRQARAARKRHREIAPVLNEQGLRRFVAQEAKALGHGGGSLMSGINGLARSTIYPLLAAGLLVSVGHGLSDIRDNGAVPAGPVRKAGGGHKKKSSRDPTLAADLKRLVEPVTRGDPMQPLLWTTRNLVTELAKEGHKVCPGVVSELLRGRGYSLQANNKTREGGQHIDRDAQFQYINTQATTFLASNEPVLSFDTKKKELGGNFKNNGREWRRQGRPELVNIHDFIDPKLSRAVPYGVYDISNNVGWVSVGTDHDTASFAVNAIRRWWRTMGKKRHPTAIRLMITANGGGSNGSRVRLWKVELQKLADELKLPITVCHLPPGTSQWNKIEHRLFSFITINWRGTPLRSYRSIDQLIAATTTDAGLKVRAELDEKKYPKGVKVSDLQMAAINLIRHSFHGDWNYTISPHRKTHRSKAN